MKFLTWLLVAVAATGCAGGAAPNDELRLSVMTFNAWGAGSNEGKTIAETVAVLRAVNADIIGLQDVRAEASECAANDCAASGPGVAAAIAEALGYEIHEQYVDNDLLWANAILSRYPISGVAQNDLGIVVTVAGRRIGFFNIHFTDYPYQPYQLLGIPYADAPMLASASGATDAARSARGNGVRIVLDAVRAMGEVDVVFVVGDFNEPSHRDWTIRAAAAARHPLSVRFPTVRAFEQAGFTDLYRAAYPDEMQAPGYTWTPTTARDDPRDHHDRIDYVLAKSTGVTVEQVQIVGESAANADLVVTPWPSDHRAVVASVSIR